MNIANRLLTWASASSLKALTSESSFSFSKAHWEMRPRERKDLFHCPSLLPRDSYVRSKKWKFFLKSNLRRCGNIDDSGNQYRLLFVTLRSFICRSDGRLSCGGSINHHIIWKIKADKWDGARRAIAGSLSFWEMRSFHKSLFCDPGKALFISAGISLQSATPRWCREAIQLKTTAFHSEERLWPTYPTPIHSCWRKAALHSARSQYRFTQACKQSVNRSEVSGAEPCRSRISGGLCGRSVFTSNGPTTMYKK